MGKLIKEVIIIFLINLLSINLFGWGFFSHPRINEHAVYCLPPEMVGFYKKHIDYISQHAVDPDKRSYINPKEAACHYMDINHYGEYPFDMVPKTWKEAVNKYTEDTLYAYGILPYHLIKVYYQLVDAFKEGDAGRILYLSANIGHYVADAHVPLHCNMFYDGRDPSEKGIHALWESRCVEVLYDNFNLFVGRAKYISKPTDEFWNWIRNGYLQSDTVLNVFSYIMKQYTPSEIYTLEDRNNIVIKQYSREFINDFNAMLQNMVERNFRKSVLDVASFWYTAWVNAGQPNLDILDDKDFLANQKKEEEELDYMWKHGKPLGRPNPE
ncbi:MAG TPA: zinc dependent phospholipase C family protein [Bacteroidales bacterium]|nr:zinc dependent phospholipase C family protein [Bacteroidales bacterium]HQM78830.1 zinc dependent phospholipase C family protein [Bacteroidales bacterium]